MSSWVQDLRFALRTLWKSPGFSAVAGLSLALGIGANTAIFSLADGVFLREPPVREPERLAAIYTTCRRGDPRCSSSYPDYLDYRERAKRLQDVAAYTWMTANLGAEAGSRLVVAQASSGNYFDLLGVRTRVGRLFGPNDDHRGGTPVVVLSDELWRSHFGGDPSIVGRTVRLNRTQFTVIGVTPPGFRGLHVDGGPDVYVPLLVAPALATGFVVDDSRFDIRGSRWIAQLVGRLAPGATIEQARSEMLAISEQLRAEDPAARGPRSVTVDAVSGYILPGAGRAELVRFLLLLVGVVGFTLLLACANLANLLLARASARQREIGIRLALGAGRRRLVAQLLCESVTLAALGGAAGLLVALWILELLSGFELPGPVVVGSLAVALDVRMLAVAGGVSLVTGLLFGLVPAFQATRLDLVTSLKGEEEKGWAGGGGWRIRRALVAVQVALCLLLLVGSGLFLRALRTSLEFDPGFVPERVALARFDLSLLRYTEAEGRAFVARLLGRAEALPWVEAASVATLTPLERGGFSGTFVTVDGYEAAPDEEMRVDVLFASPGYFRALGIPLLAGRSIGPRDREGSPAVAVVNREMARRWWPAGDAIGGRVRFAGQTLEVVGVGGDPKWRELLESATPFLIAPLAQYPAQSADGFLTLAVRTTTDPQILLPAIREEFRALDPELSLQTLETMQERIARVLMPQRMGALLLSLFGALALALAAVGIYGVVGFSVARQTREIAVRIALGAGGRDVLAHVARGMLLPVGAGLGLGLLVALALARSIEGFLFGVSPSDPLTYAGIGAGLTALAALATWLPARRAARIDPMETLRHE